jgi:hypothetical protein
MVFMSLQRPSLVRKSSKIVLRKMLIENMNTASTDVPQIVKNDNADTGTIFAESPSVQTCDIPTACIIIMYKQRC